jgi:hypothetical protein
MAMSNPIKWVLSPTIVEATVARMIFVVSLAYGRAHSEIHEWGGDF